MKTWFAFRCWSDTPWGHRNQGIGGQLYPPPNFWQKEKQNLLLRKILDYYLSPQIFLWKTLNYNYILGPPPTRFSHLSTALHHWSFRKPSQWKISILFSFASFQSLEKRTKFEWCICVLLIHVANFNTWKKFAFSSFNFLFLSTDSFWQIMGICYHCLLSSETMSHLCPRRLIHRVDELLISNSFFFLLSKQYLGEENEYNMSDH